MIIKVVANCMVTMEVADCKVIKVVIVHNNLIIMGVVNYKAPAIKVMAGYILTKVVEYYKVLIKKAANYIHLTKEVVPIHLNLEHMDYKMVIQNHLTLPVHFFMMIFDSETDV